VDKTQEMDIKDLDTSVFLYDPSKDHDLKKLQSSHEDFQAELDGLNKDRKKILRFIILVFDKQTPLRLEFKDFFSRKGEAALMAGFKRTGKNKRFREDVEDAILGKNDKVNGMIVRYLMYFYDEDYMQLALYYQLFGIFGKEKMSEANISPQQINALNSIHKTIKELTQKLFGGDESRELKAELYRSLSSETWNLHPDRVAEKLSEGEDLFEGYEES